SRATACPHPCVAIWLYRLLQSLCSIAMTRGVATMPDKINCTANQVEKRIIDRYNNRTMNNFRFSTPIQVRYGDLDPQWHVNNAHFLTFFEHARITYLIELGLFDGQSFFDLGLIVADIHIAYKAPLKLTDPARAWMRATKIGNKSLNFEYVLNDDQTGVVYATAEFTMVAYDYHFNQSIRVPDVWRQKIGEFEGQDFSS
ncbi:MAG: thioesterase family protein, partial [Anaerolineaceae bacterium]